jgi:anti-anti-sigma factor
VPVREVSPPIGINVEHQHEASILVASGVLNNSTYRDLREAVIKAALDEPSVVIVDVNGLSVPQNSAWSVFTSARWCVSTWPDVPIMLVCPLRQTRRTITACGVARYVPVYATRESALVAVDELSSHGRRRARTRLPTSSGSMHLARTIVADWLTKWDQRRLIPVACTVATVFVENVLAHTDSAPIVIVESYQDSVTIAVEDRSHQPATRHEDPDRGAQALSGLSIVAALSRAWGSTPTPSGKTVWALIDLEDEP